MALAALLWLPAAQAGDFSEFSDPLVYLGLPIVIVCVAAGALFGVLTTRPAAATAGRRVASIAAGAVIVLAVWFALFAMGLV